MNRTVALPAEPAWRSVARSWLSMKTWVKAWLVFLNVVFLCAPAFDDPLAEWSLLAYAGAGLLIVPGALALRGLSRILGVAHLVPWLPLLAYLELRLTTDLAGVRIDAANDPALFAWALVLWITLVVCLAFDVVDVVRWLRGERYILGSEEAVAKGASSAAPRWDQA
jgi:hypothetical protein